MARFRTNGEHTLASANAEAISTDAATYDSLLIINPPTNTNNILVGNSNPTITLEPRDTFELKGVSPSSIYAKGTSGERVEWVASDT